MKHPKGLYLLFATEMAERFSYYGMRALFTLYMIAAFFTMEEAAEVYGVYTGLVYLTPLIGGYVADRYWGNCRCIVVGALVMALGQLLMFLSACAVDVAVGADGVVDGGVNGGVPLWLMYGGLACLIVGCGFFKPNISTMVGDLYVDSDRLRDSAFTIFYMGINIGATLAPIVCGIFEGDRLNPGCFKWGFLCACVAMLLSVGVFVMFKNRLLRTPDGRAIGGRPQRVVGVKAAQEGSAEARLTRSEWMHIAVILIVSVFVIFFWSAYEQAGVSLTYFAEEQVDRHVMGWEMSTSWFQMFPAIFCVALAPVMAGLWQWLSGIRVGRRSLEPSSIQKQALGLLFLSLGYLVIWFGVDGLLPGQRISMVWIIVLYLILELGELSLSPIGLSLVSKLSPKRFASLLMGVWFLSSAVSNFLAGHLATLYPDPSSAPKCILGYEVASLQDFFMIFVVMSAAASLLFFLLSPVLHRMMK